MVIRFGEGSDTDRSCGILMGRLSVSKFVFVPNYQFENGEAYHFLAETI